MHGKTVLLAGFSQSEERHGRSAADGLDTLACYTLTGGGATTGAPQGREAHMLIIDGVLAAHDAPELRLDFGDGARRGIVLWPPERKVALYR